MIEMKESAAYLALQKPSDFGYWGDEQMFKTWGSSGFYKTRDASLLEQSNFEVISKDLLTKFPEDFRIENYGHWAHGYVDLLVVKILKDEEKGIEEQNITNAFSSCLEWHDKLNDYPVADENHLSEMEFEKFKQDLAELFPFYYMINTNDENWAEKLYDTMLDNCDYILLDDFIYPDNSAILKYVYFSGLYNFDYEEEWNKWTDENEFPRIQKVRENPNQLDLFSDWM